MRVFRPSVRLQLIIIKPLITRCAYVMDTINTHRNIFLASNLVVLIFYLPACSIILCVLSVRYAYMSGIIFINFQGMMSHFPWFSTMQHKIPLVIGIWRSELVSGQKKTEPCKYNLDITRHQSHPRSGHMNQMMFNVGKQTVDLNPDVGIYKAENFIFSPVSSLRSWRSQVSHLFLWRLRNPVYLAQVYRSNDRAVSNTGL